MMPIKILPNQSRAFHTPAQAWGGMLNIIEQFGDPIVTEDMQLTREVLNLQVTVLEPCNPENWPIQNSGWSLPVLEVYANTEILSPVIPEGFRYSYGGRLFAYPFPGFNIDQITEAIDYLRNYPTTRRAIAITWHPESDPESESVPCLQSVNFLHRAGKLHLTAYFRSWDVKQAAPANMYGLSRLLSYVSEKVGVSAGSLTIFAASAHCYEV